MKGYFEFENGYESDWIKGLFHFFAILIGFYKIVWIFIALTAGEFLYIPVLLIEAATILFFLKLLFHTSYKGNHLIEDKIQMQKQIDWLIENVYEGDEKEAASEPIE